MHHCTVWGLNYHIWWKDGSKRPITLASRSLANAETHYSQLDKEALAIIFGVKHFHQCHLERLDDHSSSCLIMDLWCTFWAHPRLPQWWPPHNFNNRHCCLVRIYDYKIAHKGGRIKAMLMVSVTCHYQQHPQLFPPPQRQSIWWSTCLWFQSQLPKFCFLGICCISVCY